MILLRKTEPDVHRPFKCPLVPLVPALGIASCFLLMLSLPVVTWIRFIAWMALGFAIYFLYGFRKTTQAANAKMMLEDNS